MKTGLGLFRKIRIINAYWNCFRFNVRKYFLGFDVANGFLKRVDKYSVKAILIMQGATIGKNVDIETGITFHNCTSYKNLVIGDNCHVGKNCFFDLRDKVVIGNNVVISMQCTFITHIDLNKSPLRENYPTHKAPISIGANCYLGTNTIVLKGVTLGNSVFSAAGSVVNKNIEDHCLIGGVPARVIKKHFKQP